MNISSRVLFSFFEKPVHILIKPVQVLGFWASKCVQLQRRRVQVFNEKLNMSKGEPVQLFPRKAEHVKAKCVQVGFSDSTKSSCGVTT